MKEDGNFKIVETKLKEGSSNLSTGQKRTRKNVKEGNQLFEVRSENKDLSLKKGQIIKVDEYEIKYKYPK